MLKTEEVVQAQSEALKAIGSASQKTLEGFQKLAALNLQTAKASIETATEQIKALLAAKDLKNLTELVSSLAKPSGDKFVAYAKAVYATSSETGLDLVDLVRGQLEKGNHQLLAQIQEFAKNTPAGSDGAVQFTKQVLSAATSAYEQLTTATKSFVDASLSGLGGTVVPPVSAAPAPSAPSGGKAPKA